MVTRRQKQRHVPPSRLRYEAAHPTVTLRLDRKLYEELKALKLKGGQSVADVLKVGLRKTKATVEKASEKAYEKGYAHGYEEAKEEYQVTYWCSECKRRHLTILSDEAKEAAANLMYQAGWHGLDCSKG